MASTSLPASNTYQYRVRSISLPPRSHPLPVRVEEGLHMLKTWATSSLLQAAAPPTAELLCVGLQALEDMYDCVEELLRLPRTQSALARHPCEKWAAEELDSSVRLLDICGTTRDAISSMKQQAQSLQSALRTRRVEDSLVQSKVHAFLHSGKNARKDSNKCSKTLKQMESRHTPCPLPAADQDLSLGLRALRDLREISVTVLRSISAFMAKPRRWLPTSRTSEGEENASELEKIEASLRFIQVKRSEVHGDGFEKKVEEAQRRLLRLEVGMGVLEMGLDSLFTWLIRNRVSLLNIRSAQ